VSPDRFLFEKSRCVEEDDLLREKMFVFLLEKSGCIEAPANSLEGTSMFEDEPDVRRLSADIFHRASRRFLLANAL
jgi:hypothetical protein